MHVEFFLDVVVQFRLSGVAFKLLNTLKAWSITLIFVLIANEHDVAIEVYDLFSELGTQFQVWKIHQTFKVVEHVLDIFEKIHLKQLLAIWARCSLRNLYLARVSWTFDSIERAHKGFDYSSTDLVNIFLFDLMHFPGVLKAHLTSRNEYRHGLIKVGLEMLLSH